MAKIKIKPFSKNSDKDGVNRIKEKFPDPSDVDARTSTQSYKKSLKNMKRESYQPNERIKDLPSRLKIKKVQKENAFNTAEYLRKEHNQDRKALSEIAKDTEQGSYSRKLAKSKPQKIRDIKVRIRFNREKQAEREWAGREKRSMGKERMMSRKEAAMLRDLARQVKKQEPMSGGFGGGSGAFTGANKKEVGK